jgi:hypothetical protein
MTNKEAFKQLRESLFGAKKDQKFATEITTTDGTTLQCDDLAVGNVLYVNGEPADEGTYSTPDQEITVDSNGTIQSIESTDSPDGGDQTEMAADDASAETMEATPAEAAGEKVDDVKSDHIKALEDQVTELKKELEALKSKSSTDSQEMAAVKKLVEDHKADMAKELKKFARIPGAPSAEKQTFAAQSTPEAQARTKAEEFKRLRREEIFAAVERNGNQ